MVQLIKMNRRTLSLSNTVLLVLLFCAGICNGVQPASAVGLRRSGAAASSELGKLLRAAARAGNLIEVKRLEDQGADINAAMYGVTPLWIAAQNGHLDVVQWLADQGADVNATNKYGRTPLCLAALGGHRAVVDYLLGIGADINTEDNRGRTALFWASWKGHKEVIEALVGNEAEPEICAACALGDLDRVKQLVQFGRTRVGRDAFDYVPMCIAATNGNLDVVQWLVGQGSEVNAAGILETTALHLAAASGHLQMVQYLVGQGAELDALNSQGRTALHQAVSSGNLEVVKFLLRRGAKVEASGWTSLHEAACKGYKDVLRVILDAGADVNAKNDRQTALHMASWKGHKRAVEYLVSKGAEIDAADSLGKTALHEAAEHGHVEVVKYLLSCGAKVDGVHSRKDTPLIVAAKGGRVDVVKYLVRKRADVNLAGTAQFTPLHQAAKSGHLKVVKFLVAAGAKVNARTMHGATALHKAAGNGDIEIIRYLTEVGGKVNAVDKHGWTPLHCAARPGHLDAARCLVSAGVNVSIRSTKEWDKPFPSGSRAIDVAQVKGWQDVVFLLKNASNFLKKEQLKNLRPHTMSAITSRSPNDILKALNAGVETSLIDDNGDSMLHAAAEIGDTDLIRTLLKFGCEIDLKNKAEETPLELAVCADRKEAALLLLQSGARLCNLSKKVQPAAVCMLVEVAEGDLLKQSLVMLSDVQLILNTSTPEGRLALCEAVQRGNAAIVKLLLAYGARVNVTSPFYDSLTPLTLSIRSQNPEITQLLLQYGCTHEDHYNALREALKIGFVSGAEIVVRGAQESLMEEFLRAEQELVQDLLRNQSVAQFFSNLLVNEIRKQNGEFIDLLCGSGVSVNCIDSFGDTPLITAVKSRNNQMVQKILSQSVPVNVSDLSEGRAALSYACEHGSGKMVGYLLEAHADVNAVDQRGQSPLLYGVRRGNADVVHMLCDAGAEVNVHDTDLKTPLMYAALNRSSEMATKLLERGADTDAHDSKGNSALHYAALANAHSVVNLLLDRGANVNDRTQASSWGIVRVLRKLARTTDEPCGAGGWTPLMLASLYNAPQAAEVLLARGAKKKAALTSSSRTKKVVFPSKSNALSIARQLNHDQVVSVLNKTSYKRFDDDWTLVGDAAGNAGASQGTHKPGKNPILVAVVENDIKLTKQLLSDGAPVDTRDEDGKTLLHLAVERGHYALIVELIGYGASLNAQVMSTKDRERTALCLAVMRQDEQGVDLLLSAGADPDVADDKNNTPLHWAVGKKNTALVRQLLSYRANTLKTNNQGRTAQSTMRDDDREMRSLFEEHQLSVCLVEPRSCTICLNDEVNAYKEWVKIRECGHEFHEICSRGFVDECPNCRQQLSPSSLEPIGTAAGTGAENNEVFDLRRDQNRVQKQIRELHQELARQQKNLQQTAGLLGEGQQQQRKAIKKLVVNTKGAIDRAHEEQRILQERRKISSRLKLHEFYHTIRSELSKAFIGAQALHSDMFKTQIGSDTKSAGKKAGKWVLKALCKLGGSIPFVSSIVELAESATEAAFENHLKHKMGTLLEFAADSTEFNEIVEVVAREITLTRDQELGQMVRDTYDPSFMGGVREKFKKAKDVLTANMIDNPIKELGAEVAGKLLDAILNEEVHPAGDRVEQLCVCVLGERSRGVSDCGGVGVRTVAGPRVQTTLVSKKLLDRLQGFGDEDRMRPLPETNSTLLPSAPPADAASNLLNG